MEERIAVHKKMRIIVFLLCVERLSLPGRRLLKNFYPLVKEAR